MIPGSSRSRGVRTPKEEKTYSTVLTWLEFDRIYQELREFKPVVRIARDISENSLKVTWILPRGKHTARTVIFRPGSNPVTSFSSGRGSCAGQKVKGKSTK